MCLLGTPDGEPCDLQFEVQVVAARHAPMPCGLRKCTSFSDSFTTLWGVQLDVFALCFLLTLFRLVGTPIHIGERHRTHDLHSLPSSQTTVCSRAIDPVHFTWNRRHACNQAVVTRV
jgi:hypothetical protein